MADLTTCPSCQATLRIPAGAERIKCPACATQIDIAPPVAKRVDPPLPFDRPKPPTKAPVAKPLPPEKPVNRGRVVYDDDDEEREEVRKPKRRKPMEDDPRYDEMSRLCWNARMGLRLLSFAAASSFIAALCYGLFLGSIAIASTTITLLLIITLAGLAFRSLFFLAGFVGCLFGPPGMRGTAVIGICVTLVHAGLIIPLAVYGFVLLAQMAAATDDIDKLIKLINRVVFVISSTINNPHAFTEFPWMFYRGDFDKSERGYIIMMVIGACLEFMMMAILGTVVQHYASEGKGHELGFKSLKFVYRIMWVILIVGVLKLALLAGMVQFMGDLAATAFFRIPHTLVSIGYFLWWAFAWYEQYRSMSDTMDVVIASRYLDKRRFLDVV